MGGRYSKHRADRALFHVQSTSLDSISTAASLSTCRNGNVPTHSPSMDTIHQRSKLPGKQPVKQVKGNTYMLLDTVSTDYEAASLLGEEEEERAGVKKGSGEGGGGRQKGSGGRDVEGEGGKGKGNEKSLQDGRLAEEGGEGEEDRGGEKAHLTSSLPSEVERHIGRAEAADEFPKESSTRDGQTDGESNKDQKTKTCQNVSPTADPSEMEREVQQLLKSVLKQSRQASKNGYPNSSDATTGSDVPEAVLQLSSKDLDQLAMYLCSKFKDTLQTSLVKKVLQQQQQKEQQVKQRTKHVQISDDPISFGTATEGSDSPHGSELVAGQHGRPGEERLQRRRPRRPRRERPNSTPGIYWKDDPHLNLSDPQSSSTAGLVPDSPSPPYHLQTRSHSHEDCYHHRCTAEQSLDTAYSCSRQPPCRACRDHCRNSSSPNAEHSHSGGRRKRQGRSRDTPVDVSLDDNCPGVNLVRRRHHHHHSVCENCLQSLGKASSRHNRRRPKQQHSFEMPNCKDTPLGEEDQATGGGVGEGVGFITLDQLRTVAQMLHSSAGCVEQNLQRNGSPGSGPTKSQSFRHERRQQYHVKSKRKSAHLDEAVSGTKMELLQEDKDADPCLSTPEELGKLQELVYPMKSRSGRDSPATDMAVIDLSVDSPCMLQPLEGREGKEPLHSSTSVLFDSNSPDRVMHLHHHYHHIIHHGEP